MCRIIVKRRGSGASAALTKCFQNSKLYFNTKSWKVNIWDTFGFQFSLSKTKLSYAQLHVASTWTSCIVLATAAAPELDNQQKETATTTVLD